jgi:hypothetical protein
VRQQHAQVAVALLADAPELAMLTRRVLLRREAEPAREVPRFLEVSHVAIRPN